MKYITKFLQFTLYLQQSQMLTNSADSLSRAVSALWCSLRDFMTHTSSPGCKYVCEDDRRRLERLFWICAISLGVGSTTYMVHDIYNRYSHSPVKMAIQPTYKQTWQLPHPAVTICNTNRIQRTRAELLINQLMIPNDMNASSAIEALKDLILLNIPELTHRQDYSKLEEIISINNTTSEILMLRLVQPCEEMLERCSWQNEIVNCRELFEMHKSYLGFCCSFNYIGNSPGKEPIHTSMYGERMGLTVLINPAADDSFVSPFLGNGVAVLIHDSYVFADESVIMKIVPTSKEVLIPVKMVARKTSAEVDELPVRTRQCLQVHEKQLELFSGYHDNNCFTECRINIIMEVCGCVPYYYPGHQHRVCSINDTRCLSDHYDTLHSVRPSISSLRNINVEEHSKYLQRSQMAANAIACDCPAECDRIEHEARESVGNFQPSQYCINELFGPDTNDSNRILLHVYLENDMSQLVKRDISKATSVLLALLGGVCSLFLGSSIVTILELLYFVSVRLPGFFTGKSGSGPACPASPQSLKLKDGQTTRHKNGKIKAFKKNVLVFTGPKFRRSLYRWR